MEKPLRFQVVVATLAIGGALLVVDRAPAPAPEFEFRDRSIDESSGLVDLGSSVLTVNDSGSGPEIFMVDKATGETVGRTTYTGDEVVDVEALAPGRDGTVWVGDIGDNGGRRMSVAVYEVPVPQPGDRVVESRRYDLSYQGGPRDAEALLVHPRTGRLYVVSKGIFGGQVHAAPATLRTDAVNVLRPVGRAPGLVTDGAFFPDGRHVVLRTYSTMAVHDARTWSAEARAELPDQPQGEGLAMTASGRRVLVSTEGRNTDVLTVTLPRALLAAVAPEEPGGSGDEPGAGAEPGSRPEPASGAASGTGRVAGITVAGVAVATTGLLVWRLLRRRRRVRQSRSTT